MTHTLANFVFPSHPTADQLRAMQNILTCQLESARSCASYAPFGANMILGLAVHSMLRCWFWEVHHPLPNDAELLMVIDALDNDLGRLARRFYDETEFDTRWPLAMRIAERTIQTCECIEDNTPSIV